jgi:hypothetical protein
MRYNLTVLTAFIALTGCSHIPPEAYYNRGTPESLLDVSSEVVNVVLESEASIDELTNWVNQDQPTRAEVYCLQGDPVCKKANKVLEKFGVPVMYVSAADNNVSLVYERILARDCENRYIDNRANPYDLNHPTYGCSVASNIVMHVSDKHQLVSPPLMDYHDGSKAVQSVDAYNSPNTYTSYKIDRDFQSQVSSESGGGGGGQ